MVGVVSIEDLHVMPLAEREHDVCATDFPQMDRHVIPRYFIAAVRESFKHSILANPLLVDTGAGYESVPASDQEWRGFNMLG